MSGKTANKIVHRIFTGGKFKMSKTVTLHATCRKCPKCGTYKVRMYFDYRVIAEDEESQTVEESKNYICENKNCGNRWREK